MRTLTNGPPCSCQLPQTSVLLRSQTMHLSQFDAAERRCVHDFCQSTFDRITARMKRIKQNKIWPACVTGCQAYSTLQHQHRSINTDECKAQLSCLICRDHLLMEPNTGELTRVYVAYMVRTPKCTAYLQKKLG